MESPRIKPPHDQDGRCSVTRTSRRCDDSHGGGSGVQHVLGQQEMPPSITMIEPVM